MSRSALRATYRLQLRQGIGFREARRRVPLLARLGVSHLYLSPILRARQASTHGYDVVDPTQVDPALGGERGLEALVRTLRDHGMGLLLDVVPNHMAAEPAENPFFDDVLTHGPASRFAPWFDVDWKDAGGHRHAPLLLPLLGAPLSQVLARGEIRIERTAGTLRLRYFERTLPLDPATLPILLLPAVRLLRPDASGRGAARALSELIGRLRALPARNRSGASVRRERAELLCGELEALLRRSEAARRAVDSVLGRMRCAEERRRLVTLLGAQPYRLGHWRQTRLHLNYRRFFDISDLIAIRCEDPDVFEATHAKTLELVGRGWVDGLRIDHVDGLLDPGGYLRRLRNAVDARLTVRDRERFVLLTEKILARDERLPAAWPVEGTTGYEFLNQLEAVFLDPRGAGVVEAAWSKLTGVPRDFGALARQAKRRVLEDLLSADLDRLADELAHSARGRMAGRRQPLRTAIRELIAWLPVYRCYPDAEGRVSPAERRLLARALEAVRHEARASPAACASLRKALLGSAPVGRPTAPGFSRHLQQLSGPAAAKGVEDTAFYVHTALLSRNEVGGDPGAPLGSEVAQFHAACRERSRRWPQNLLAATTHDTKRSADVRSRLDVLSEIPEVWIGAVRRWQRWNRPLRRRAGRRLVPDAHTESFFYQTLVGMWPLPNPGGNGSLAAADRTALHRRVTAYMGKAVREAKLHTSWIDPDLAFEEALRSFIDGVLGGAARGSPFLADVDRFVREVARCGLWNALGRTLVQLTAPGVPDVYQGDELWSFTLVDPDNRGPVDFARRRRLLARVEDVWGPRGRPRADTLSRLAAQPEDARLKLAVVYAALQTRRRHPAVFARGDYVPLQARGRRASHVLAFARVSRRATVVVAVPRLLHGLAGEARGTPLGAGTWEDTTLVLPGAVAGRTLVSALTGQRIAVPARRSRSRPRLPVATLLRDLPVALLVARGAGRAGPGARTGG